ncbi:hypothetical protein F966_02020 [Acinetobacter higginsii]|uniref:Uncharacterized protein n=1 Tax=Acinetobacter higginsii TaxID=70347 RepID=N8XPI4_9GAMM|nr:hypothetical protein [Acinetobacter higginsii]ENV09363.1 hypothetical protein F966_02020 [Acinetobacter higginsii]
MYESDDETFRYINYLQSTLVREGSEEFLISYKQWFEKNRESFAQDFIRMTSSNSTNKHSAAVLEYKAQGEYDDFFSRQIFEPLLTKVMAIASQHGLAPKLPVHFSNSPNIEPSPAALPSNSEHILFAGQGTFSFCNYWAKVFSTAIFEVASLSKNKQKNESNVIDQLQNSHVINDAALLASCHAITGSLVGFGKLEQPVNLNKLRVELLTAMEVFIIAHEIAHFIAHEEFPDTGGIRPESNSKEHEIECDEFALNICTAFGVQENNPFSFQLIGPLLFFYALQICENTRVTLTGHKQIPSDSHPTHNDRVQFTFNFLKEVGASSNILDSASYSLRIAKIIETQVQLIMENLKNLDENAEHKTDTTCT